MARFLSLYDRVRMLAAVAAITQAQMNCKHEFNPPIRHALANGEPAKVCKLCGVVERVSDPTTSAHDAEQNNKPG